MYVFVLLEAYKFVFMHLIRISIHGYVRIYTTYSFIYKYIHSYLYIQDPFETIDEDGVGALIKMSAEMGKKNALHCIAKVMYIYTYVYIYICIYIYTYTRINTYTYTHIKLL
jgi:hypothetical protein